MTKHDFYASNEVFRKVQRSTDPADDKTPRETPSQQSSGLKGYSKPEFDSWTDEELAEHAKKLGINLEGNVSRETLINALIKH